jgi:predicted lipoprotein with Yx(FWY)xxD motif
MTRLHAPRAAAGGRRGALFGLAALAFALAGAGCGGAIPSSDGGPARVEVSNGHLVDGAGRSLYLFERDDGGESYCTDACAAVWPPLETNSAPQGGGAVAGSALGTIVRGDGDRQVTYHGHPLYYYAADASKPGSTRGQEVDQFGAEWYLLAASGNPAASQGNGGSGGSNGGGGGGY